MSNNNTEANNNAVVARSIREVQQSFAESLGFGNEIIWDLLSDGQAHILNTKIESLIPNPSEPKDLPAEEIEKAAEKWRKQCGVFERMRETLFSSVWEQRKYTNRQSLTSIFYVLVATNETDHNTAEDSKSWSCHPVFRARRCISDSSGSSSNSSDCCMIYVDENGRVYQNWASYLAENELPEGILVAPRRGVYNFNARKDVILESWQTPAASPQRKVLGALDTTTAVAGLTAACVPIAALAVTVAAPVMLFAGAVGLASAGYATARSGAQLVDRSLHEQSINVTDRTARSHWLGVIAGAVGLGAAGATSAMTAATNAGREVGAITQLTVNSMNISSIMMSGTGVVHGVIDLYLKHQDGDDISTMDYLQLSASLFLFTHSVCNFKLASTIINDTSNRRIASYRDTLSNRQRRIFDKMVKETTRVRGVRQANMDIIRNVNEMPSRQQFNDLYKINRNLNREGVRPMFASNGQGVVLNDQVVINTAELRASVQHNVGPDVLGQVTNPIPETFNASSGNAARGNNTAAGGITGRVFTGSAGLTEPTTLETPESTRNWAEGVRALRWSTLIVNGVGLALSKYGESLFERIINAESFETVLLSLADNLKEDMMNYILNLTDLFMSMFWEQLNTVLKLYITSESVLYRIGTHIMDNYRHLTAEQIERYTDQILQAVEDYFMSLNPNSFPDLLTVCKICNGYFSICEL